MAHQHSDVHEEALREGWSRPKPEVLAEPTCWPPGVALGSTLIAWGLITSVIVLLVGLATFALSLAGWIQDIRHENKLR